MLLALMFLLNILGSLYLLVLLLRFLLQAADADYYNPVSQTVVRLTDLPVRLFRRYIPAYKSIDFSILAVAAVLEVVFITGLGNLYSLSDPIFLLSAPNIISWAFLGVVTTLLDLIFFTVIISIIMSFVVVLSGNPVSHPVLRLAMELGEPLLAPFRKFLPSMGGLDFSPIFLFISIILVENVLGAAIPTENRHELLFISSDSILTNFLFLIYLPSI